MPQRPTVGWTTGSGRSTHAGCKCGAHLCTITRRHALHPSLHVCAEQPDALAQLLDAPQGIPTLPDLFAHEALPACKVTPNPTGKDGLHAADSHDAFADCQSPAPCWLVLQQP